MGPFERHRQRNQRASILQRSAVLLMSGERTDAPLLRWISLNFRNSLGCWSKERMAQHVDDFFFCAFLVWSKANDFRKQTKTSTLTIVCYGMYGLQAQDPWRDNHEPLSQFHEGCLTGKSGHEVWWRLAKMYLGPGRCCWSASPLVRYGTAQCSPG